jgi:hypothetical protein
VRLKTQLFSRYSWWCNTCINLDFELVQDFMLNIVCPCVVCLAIYAKLLPSGRCSVCISPCPEIRQPRQFGKGSHNTRLRQLYIPSHIFFLSSLFSSNRSIFSHQLISQPKPKGLLPWRPALFPSTSASYLPSSSSSQHSSH